MHHTNSPKDYGTEVEQRQLDNLISKVEIQNEHLRCIRERLSALLSRALGETPGEQSLDATGKVQELAQYNKVGALADLLGESLELGDHLAKLADMLGKIA